MKRITGLVLIISICMLCVTGCRQEVMYEYDLSGTVLSVSGDEITICPVAESAGGNEYQYWIGEVDKYFVMGENYVWNAVYPQENNEITLKLTSDLMRTNNGLDEFMVNSEGKMVNLKIKNGIVTNLRLTQTDVAYKMNLKTGVAGELYHNREYMYITLDDIYTVFWRVYDDCFNIHIYNDDLTEEYNLNITGSNLARCYLLDNDTDEMKIWLDAMDESLLITISNGINISAYNNSLDIDSEGQICNSLIDGTQSDLRVTDYDTGEYLPVNYK